MALGRILLGYDKNTDTLKVADEGEGDLDDLAEELSDGKVLYGLIGMKVDDKKKFVFIVWTGEGVPALRKGLVHAHSGQVAKFVGHYHLQLNARTESDLDQDKVLGRLKSAGGANYDATLSK
uniref:ADF-H domain-containing protein n=1 Tax=Palpitomonas bilix TaxID=652834 RepID=A0A7S3CY77_9EUKA|mmetsp:Transcript_14301/g.36413  ORF Transcript_14301/g.36413 Transcript_14301/m.36413 type:complete len:122 (+) Transcript_14301:297-662(+)